jgi:hypothetical protein
MKAPFDELQLDFSNAGNSAISNIKEPTTDQTGLTTEGNLA